MGLHSDNMLCPGKDCICPQLSCFRFVIMNSLSSRPVAPGELNFQSPAASPTSHRMYRHCQPQSEGTRESAGQGEVKTGAPGASDRPLGPRKWTGTKTQSKISTTDSTSAPHEGLRALIRGTGDTEVGGWTLVPWPSWPLKGDE